MDEELEGTQDDRVDKLWSQLSQNEKLDIKRLRKGLRKINHPLKDADQLLHDVVKAVDTDGDGIIQYSEFAAFVKHAEKQLWLLFKSIDLDKDNRLSRTELEEAFKRAGINVSKTKLNEFFSHVDANHDGQITFDEWRDFLLFMPAHVPGLRSVLSYYTGTVKVNPEGDVHLSDETIESLGTFHNFFILAFGVFRIFQPPRIRHYSPAAETSERKTQSAFRENSTSAFEEGSASISQISATMQVTAEGQNVEPPLEDVTSSTPPLQTDASKWKPLLTALLPTPGYFLAGAIAGIVSRTSTAPLDRLKVYLIAQTGTASKAIEATKSGAVVQATKHAARPLKDACIELWRAGGIRSLFAGNGLNVIKVMPESAIKFGSYEAAKRVIATFEGHNDPQAIHPWSKFVAGGIGGIVSQFFVYPIDTLKFRMQCETVQGGQHGNELIVSTAKKMWRGSGMRTFYRGLPMGLVGMFPYSAIDLGTFEYLKRRVSARNARRLNTNIDDPQAAPGNVTLAFMGGFSGAIGASLVYPLNLLRTRLQTQGTTQHPRTYTGIMDVTRQTIRGEGVRGLFKGLTPNLLKVVPAVSITYVVYENSKRIMHLH